MTAINLNSNNYQLNSSGSGSSGTNTAGANTNPSLASILGGGSTASGSSFSDAVFLDLSPAAQKYLSGLGSKAVSPKDSSNASTDFTLSAQQKTELNNVLAKYKNAPYTQETFDAIQGDLHVAGIGPDQLSAKERVSSFNSTAVLVDALNGGNGSTPGSTPVTEDSLKTKATNYMQDVIMQWKKVAAEHQETQSANAVAPIGSADGAS